MCSPKTEVPTGAPIPVKAEAGGSDDTLSSPLDKLKAVYLSVFIDVLGIGLVIPVLPYLILSFDGAKATEVGLVIAVYSICQIPGSAIFGYISDKKGRKPVLLLSIIASAISFLFCGLARTLPLIIAARGFSGLTGGSISVAQAYIADVTTVEERPKYLGLIGATIGIAFTFGPGIGAAASAIIEACGGSVQDQYSGVFFLAAAFGFLGFLYALRYLKEVDRSGTELSTAKSGGVANVESRMLVWLLLISLAMFSSNYAFTVMQSTYGVLIMDKFGWTTSALGAILVVSGLEIAVIQGKGVKVLIDITGKHMAGVIGCVLLGVSLAALPLTTFNKSLHLLMFSVQVAGFSICQTALPALLSRYASTENQGSVLGFGQAAQAASRVIAPLISGVLYDRSEELGLGDYAAPYLLGGTLSVVCGLPLLLLLLDRRAAAAASEAEGVTVGESVEMVKVENEAQV